MKKTNTYKLVVTALFAALMCIFGPQSIPIGPVPISLTNFVIYLAAFMLGGKLACLSTFVYILLGAVGLPVFSSFSGGMGKLMGPTGGYIIGFIPMALLCGFAVSKWSNKKVLLAIIMAVGTLIAYLVGTVWFVHIQQCDIMHALEICVFPFLIPDAIKIVIAILLGGEVRKRLILLNYLDVEK